MLVMSPSITSEDKHVTAVLAIRQLDQNTEILKGFYSKLTEWVESGVIQVCIFILGLGFCVVLYSQVLCALA